MKICECGCGRPTTVATKTDSKWGLVAGEYRRFLPHHSKRKADSNTAHPLYTTWEGMRNRCNNPGYEGYKNWGGRGIAVCPRWDDFRQFAADVGPKPNGAWLERIDNDSNYEPSNCRWATPGEQLRNARRTSHIAFGGETLCITDWAIRLGVSQQTISWRIRRYGEQAAIAMGTRKNKGERRAAR